MVRSLLDFKDVEIIDKAISIATATSNFYYFPLPSRGVYLGHTIFVSTNPQAPVWVSPMLAYERGGTKYSVIAFPQGWVADPQKGSPRTLFHDCLVPYPTKYKAYLGAFVRNDTGADANIGVKALVGV